MELLKKYCNLKANSILESVIALSIISACMYITILIFAAVFSSRTSAKFYNTQNKVDELFYLLQLRKDSLIKENNDINLIIEEDALNEGTEKIIIHYKDSSHFQFEKSFYVKNDKEH